MNLVKRECKEKKCEQSLEVLMSFIMDKDGTQPDNCRFIDLGYLGDTHRDVNVNDPPCWRDGMLIRSASMLQYML